MNVTLEDGTIRSLKELTVENIGFRDHPMAVEIKANARALAQFPEYANSKQAIVSLDNGRRQVSIICGAIFYSNGIDTYEAYVVEGRKSDEGPRGYLSFDQVKDFLRTVGRRK